MPRATLGAAGAPLAVGRVDAALDALTSWWQQGRLLLVLGAGASADCKIPTWSKLLLEGARAVGLLRGFTGDPTFQCSAERHRLGGPAPSPVSGATAALAGLQEELAAETLLGETSDLTWFADLLPTAPGPLTWLADSLYKPVPPDWVQHPDFEAKALFELADLAARLAERHPNSPVHVLTYNFDTLLEEALEARGVSCEAFTRLGEASLDWGRVAGPSSSPLRMRTRSGRAPVVHILHAHGLVRRPWLEAGRKRYWDWDLVFRADQYDDRMNEGLSGRNLPQAFAFGARASLFYGFSFTDYQIRRLLRSGHLVRRGIGGFVEDEAKHIALLAGPSEKDGPCLPGKMLRADRELLFGWKETRLHEALGVEVLRFDSFPHHRRFVNELNRRLR